MDKLDVVEIEEVVTRTPTTKTLYFDWVKDIDPGQFVMIWIPGVDEVPMSMSHHGERQAITVRNVGKATEELHEMEVGDKLGVRGPFGNGYSLEYNREILVVIGGIGGASLRPAIMDAVDRNILVRCALGAVNRDELLFEDEFSEYTHLHIATDDGSAGHHGFVTEIIEDRMEGVDAVLTCGPEIMMKKTVDTAREKGIPVQASLERYMKCGLGLCDSCSIDGYQVCRDGPVFDGETLEKMSEFGRFERSKTGIKEKI